MGKEIIMNFDSKDDAARMNSILIAAQESNLIISGNELELTVIELYDNKIKLVYNIFH